MHYWRRGHEGAAVSPRRGQTAHPPTGLPPLLAPRLLLLKSIPTAGSGFICPWPRVAWCSYGLVACACWPFLACVLIREWLVSKWFLRGSMTRNYCRGLGFICLCPHVAWCSCGLVTALCRVLCWSVPACVLIREWLLRGSIQRQNTTAGLGYICFCHRMAWCSYGLVALCLVLC